MSHTRFLPWVSFRQKVREVCVCVCVCVCVRAWVGGCNFYVFLYYFS